MCKRVAAANRRQGTFNNSSSSNKHECKTDLGVWGSDVWDDEFLAALARAFHFHCLETATDQAAQAHEQLPVHEKMAHREWSREREREKHVCQAA